MGFICFVLSFLISNVFGWTEQGKAFLYINLGAGILITLLGIAIYIISCLDSGWTEGMNVISFIAILNIAGALAIILFATWVATKLFNIDFFVAYQIMTFGQCLCTDSKNNQQIRKQKINCKRLIFYCIRKIIII